MTNDRQRKYNNQDDLDQLCRSLMQASETGTGAAIEYCMSFLMLLDERMPNSGAVLSSRAKSH